MFLENFEKYMRERLLPYVTLSRDGQIFTLTDKDDYDLVLSIVVDEYGRETEHDFLVFENVLPEVVNFREPITEYYMSFESSDYEELEENPPYEDLLHLGDEDFPSFGDNWWWSVKDDVSRYPKLGNYFDTSKPR